MNANLKQESTKNLQWLKHQVYIRSHCLLVEGNCFHIFAHMLENAHFFLYHKLQKLQMHTDFMKKTLSVVVMRLLFRKFRNILLNN